MHRKKLDGWMDRLKSVYNRGFWDGYYLGQTMGEWAGQHGSLATHRKEYVGKVTNYFGKLNVRRNKDGIGLSGAG